MIKRNSSTILCAGLMALFLAGHARAVPYTNVVNGTTNILVGSFLIRVDSLAGVPWQSADNRLTNAVSWTGLATRGENGQDQTRGAVPGELSFICGHPVGLDGYEGIDLNLWSGDNQWRDMNRFGGRDDRGGLLFWDYDLSAYLDGKDIGTIPGQSQFLVKVNYGERRSGNGKVAAPFYISYNDGAGLTLDSTITTNLTPAPELTYSIITNTDHFVQIGVVPNPPQAGTVVFDITDHILASTDKVFRVAAFVTEYLGDLKLLDDSGIIEAIVDLEKAPPYISDYALAGSDWVLTWYSTTNRTYALETASDLAAADWTPLNGHTNIQGGVLTTSVTNAPGGGGGAVRIVGLPPPTLFAEDFEDGATDWVLDGSGVWAVGVPTYGATNAVSGANVAGTVLGGPYPENVTAGLRTPVIDLTSATRATLSYWQYLYVEGFDYARVFVRDAAGNPLPEPLDVAIYEHDGDSSEYPWAQNTVSLPPEAMGQQITLEFELESDVFDAFAGWYIDDVLILEQ